MRKLVSGIALVVVAVVGMVGLVKANEAHNLLLKRSSKERNAVLTKQMKESGENCVVKENFFQGMAKDGKAFWSIRCTNGKAFLVMIEPDAVGSTTILDCGVFKLVAGGECFKKFDN